MSALPASNRLMTQSTLLGVWLGAAMLVASVVAPAAFAVLPSRALAGTLIGRVLPPVFLAGVVIGSVNGMLTWLGSPEAYARSRIGANVAVALACAFAQFVIAPRIAAVRAAIGPSVEALAPDDARRVAFGRLHGFSVLWLGVAILGAIAGILFASLATRGARQS